ncbi:MAG: DUF6599 family protein [Deltaproteobacteria bacterium]
MTILKNAARRTRPEQFTGWGFVLAVISLLISCQPKTHPSSVDFLPASDVVDGWKKTSDTRTFPVDRLYEYIDGDADKYVQAGVVETLTADYTYNGKFEAVADVFVMAGADGAAKIFDSQSASGSQPSQVGDVARLYQGMLVYRKGRYFVRIVAYQDDSQIADAMVALGSSIAAKLE